MLASFHAYDDCRCLLWLKLPVFNVLKGGGLLGIFCLLFPSGDPPVLGAGISVASALRSSLYVAVPHLRVHGVPMSLSMSCIGLPWIFIPQKCSSLFVVLVLLFGGRAKQWATLFNHLGFPTLLYILAGQKL